MKINKRFMLILTLSALVIFGCAALVFANDGSRNTNSNMNMNTYQNSLADPEASALVPKEDVYHVIDVNKRRTITVNGRTRVILYSPDVSDSDLYVRYYRKATAAQKEQLDRIVMNNSISIAGQWTRDVLLLFGELPKDTPRLTLRDVELIYERVNKKIETNSLEMSADYAYPEAFNEIAGAPDWEGGSGRTQWVYYLDDERKQVISLLLGHIEYYDYRPYNEKNPAPDTMKPTPIKGQKLPPPSNDKPLMADDEVFKSWEAFQNWYHTNAMSKDSQSVMPAPTPVPTLMPAR